MRPPLLPPQAGKRLPPKPTKGEVEQLLEKQARELTYAERRARHLARTLVLLLRGTFFERVRFALCILFRRPLRIPFPRLAEVSAEQLDAVAEKGHFAFTADDGPKEEKLEAPLVRRFRDFLRRFRKEGTNGKRRV